MSEYIRIGSYEIIITDRADGDASDPNHEVYSIFHATVQVHGTNVLVVWPDLSIGKSSVEADALIGLDTQGVGVRVADCLPLILIGEDHTAAVHCGRKWLKSGIITAVLEKLVTIWEDLQHIHYFIGPCIRTYEVGNEFTNYFPMRFLIPLGEKYLFDLVGYTRYALSIEGVVFDQGVVHPECTLRNIRYFSYRRDGAVGTNFVWVRKR